ncbi:VanZ family protein [Paenibacillus wulumuqiensis]|uniref:VanZ family protein n=1 Tax=Paenibacillus wulumuqiensis TaxID=1567107 RepID=UPI00061A014F|nr:VanZ family protein [Paenibacillus wulumuqiensis]
MNTDQQRIQNKQKASASANKLSVLPILLLAGYTLLLFYWMFFGFGRTDHPGAPYRYNLVPFRTVIDFATLRVGSPLDRLINLLGNIGVFVPFGLLVPWIRRVKLRRFLVGFVCCIFVVEVMQMLSRRGTFDIDDIWLNTLGAWIGYMLWSGIQRLGWRR